MDVLEEIENNEGGPQLAHIVTQLTEENGVRAIKQSKYFTSMGEVYYGDLSTKDKAIWDAFVLMISNK